ncbi:sigma-70 family RNA polymerase sigma factor [Jiangella alkaliphila]|uniref:RNA polymerase sigma-70 factor, ECF subfamily n=1 Tax=Jiangella alkaliphila TaxID=419479 RepID=A0A1H2LQP9_9ACTN|nr:sigma-70 family RNA polymerase sigma factor [Jiangella alkaliphila]SDU82911.1 RNA polymerase sigma-70 factor, ECF subfamily [Jiangella alkaliphila]
MEDLTGRFEAHRGHLRAVAYRMLGSLSEADDAVQETWLRLSRSDVSDVRNLGGWLTTVIGRICLDLLRSRASRREEPLDVRIPDPIIASADGTDPEQEAVRTDSVGLALLVVMDTLSPAERLAYVLHDMFAVPFDEIGPIVGRSKDAAKMLASRARRRVEDANAVPDTDLPRQRRAADAFLAAARGGDFDALVAVLDPDVVLRGDFGDLRPSELIRGARNVAEGAVRFAEAALHSRPVLVNGVPGLVTAPDGQPLSVMAFTVRGGRITQIDVLADPARLGRLDLTAFGSP